MHAAHQMVSLDKAIPGMTLSDAILDRQGKVLLSQGTVLTASTIAALGRHDVAVVPISVLSEEAQAPIDVAAVSARLAHVFRADPATGTANALLRQFVEDYRLERGVAP